MLLERFEISERWRLKNGRQKPARAQRFSAALLENAPMLRPITHLPSQFREAWHEERKKVVERRLRIRGKIFHAEEGEKRMQADPILRIDRHSRNWNVALLRKNGGEAHLNPILRSAVAGKIARSILRA